MRQTANNPKLLIGKHKAGKQGGSSRPAKANGGGFIPDHITFPQVFDEHEHVDGVYRPVHTASK